MTGKLFKTIAGILVVCMLLFALLPGDFGGSAPFGEGAGQIRAQAAVTAGNGGTIHKAAQSLEKERSLPFGVSDYRTASEAGVSAFFLPGGPEEPAGQGAFFLNAFLAVGLLILYQKGIERHLAMHALGRFLEYVLLLVSVLHRLDGKKRPLLVHFSLV